jgi:hypothetical protein
MYRLFNIVDGRVIFGALKRYVEQIFDRRQRRYLERRKGAEFITSRLGGRYRTAF